MTEEEGLLKKLILISSLSGQEKNIAEYIFRILNKAGFKTKKLPVNKDRFNIIARLGNPKIYLSSHMDTVSPFISYRENKTHIFGRGACDTKASIATMITAALSAQKQGITNFGLIFTVGEETTFDGVRSITRSKIKIPFVVVGEPTKLRLVYGHYGMLILKITTKGKAAHTSQPQKGINAIDTLIDIIFKIRNIPIHPESLMSIVRINGGTSDTILPSEASAILSFRISPNDHTKYARNYKTLFGKKVKIYTIHTIKAVKSKVPNKLSFIKSRSIEKYLTELYCYKSGVVLGPGDIRFAHSEDEKVSKNELSKAVKIYLKILDNYSKTQE